MNHAALFQTCLGFGSGLILGELTLVHSLEKPDQTAQEKTRTIALAALSGGSTFCSYILPEEISPLFSGISLGLSVELINGARKNTQKEHTYANLATISALFFLHSNQESALVFLPLILGFGATSFLKQNREERLMKQNLLDFINLPLELNEEYEPKEELELVDNPMLYGNPPKIPLDPVLKRNDSSQVYDRSSISDRRCIPLKKYKEFIDDCLFNKEINIDKMREAIAEFKGYQTPPSSPRKRNRSRSRSRSRTRT